MASKVSASLENRVQKLEQQFTEISSSMRKIEVFVERISVSVEATAANTAKALVELSKDFERHDQIFHGVGATPGLIVEIDRLKVADRKRDYWLKTMGGALAALFGKFFYDLLHR